MRRERFDDGAGAEEADESPSLLLLIERRVDVLRLRQIVVRRRLQIPYTRRSGRSIETDEFQGNGAHRLGLGLDGEQRLLEKDVSAVEALREVGRAADAWRTFIRLHIAKDSAGT